jgi:hypothetical protein
MLEIKGDAAGEVSKASIHKAQKASKDPKHDKFKRIKSLPPELYQNTLNMLKRHSPRVIAELLQDEGFNTDIQPVTLAHILEDFRSATIPLDEMVDPYVVGKITERYKTNVNVFSETSDLILMQKERVRQARLKEQETGELSPDGTKQIHTMARLLKTYGDLGIKAGLLNSFIDEFQKSILQEQDYIYCSVDRMAFNLFKKMYQDNPKVFEGAMMLATDCNE